MYHYLVCDGNQDQDSGAAAAVWIIDLLRSQLLFTTLLLLCLTLTFFSIHIFFSPQYLHLLQSSVSRMTTEYYGYRNGHSLNTGAAQYRHKARKVREENGWLLVVLAFFTHLTTISI